MDKKEIPPTAAPAELFSLLEKWAEEIEESWDEVLTKAGVRGRSTPWRMSKGTAGLETAADIERALREIERRKGISANTAKILPLTKEWTRLGMRLAMLDSDQFRRFLDAVRKIVEGLEAVQSPQVNPER